MLLRMARTPDPPPALVPRALRFQGGTAISSSSISCVFRGRVPSPGWSHTFHPVLGLSACAAARPQASGRHLGTPASPASLLLVFPPCFVSDLLGASLVYFCLLSVSWQREGKPKGGVLNESLFQAVSPELEQSLAQRVLLWVFWRRRHI